MKEFIKSTEKNQATDMILLNEEFYNAMELPDREERKEISRDILRSTAILEKECVYLSWMPFLYSIIARCHFDLGDIEKAIAYARDGLYLGELEAYKDKENNMELDGYNLHPLKTQRDISMGVNDIEKAIELQKRIIKVTPYRTDEENMMVELKKIKDIIAAKYPDKGTTFDHLCDNVKWETPMKKFTTEEEVKRERGIRLNNLLRGV